VRSATVLAESATDTDALSTAAFVLGDAGAAAVLEARPGVGLVLALESDEPKLARDAGDITPRKSRLVVRTMGSATLHPAPPGVPNEGVTP
jgi:hypothetical protein